MPTNKLTFRPGINKQFTPTLNEGGWSDGNKVRFRDGLPQPIGGWISNLAVVFQGACRKLHSWVTLGSIRLQATATNSNLYIALADTLYDITPLRASISLTNPFSTTTGSATVTLAATAHGAAVADQLSLPSVSVGGIQLYGVYTVAAVPDANTLTFTAATAATSATTDGGSVAVGLLIKPGNVSNSYSSGWGVGGYGMGPFGTSRSGLTQSSMLRLWSLDHWGEELVACVRDGAIYNWKPINTYGSRATVIPNSPFIAKGVFTAMPERHLIAFGADVSGMQDPMIVRWSDVEDYTTWMASATNSAGSFRLVGGSQIVGWAAGPQEILIWTDAVLWAMRFQGLPYVYGFFQQGTTCGLIAPNAVAVINGVAYWMSKNNFYRYSGSVQVLPCSVWDSVFLNFNSQQPEKVHCAPNLGYNEISWHYASAGSMEVDRYVTLNVVDETWSLGSMVRTAWEDAGTLSYPSAAGIDGQIYVHEYGTDANGAPLDAYVESGYFDLADGSDSMFLDQVLPDFADQAGPVAVTFKGQAFPNGAQRVKGPFTIQPATKAVTARMRERQIAIRIESNTLGAFWRLGAIRTRVAPDGRKA